MKKPKNPIMWENGKRANEKTKKPKNMGKM
jgi:hypothetical protein